MLIGQACLSTANQQPLDSKVSVQGRLHYSYWISTDGVTKYGDESVADCVEFLTPAPEAVDALKRETKEKAPAKQPAMSGGLDDLDERIALIGLCRRVDARTGLLACPACRR